jgi:cell division protein FtsL
MKEHLAQFQNEKGTLHISVKIKNLCESSQQMSVFETDQLISENRSKEDEIARLNLEIRQLLVEKENLCQRVAQLEASQHQMECAFREKEQLSKQYETEYLTKIEQLVGF